MEKEKDNEREREEKRKKIARATAGETVTRIVKITLAGVTHCSIIFVIKSENTIRRAAADIILERERERERVRERRESSGKALSPCQR